MREQGYAYHIIRSTRYDTYGRGARARRCYGVTYPGAVILHFIRAHLPFCDNDGQLQQNSSIVVVIVL